MSRTCKILALSIVATALAGPAVPAGEECFKPLFNGKDLSGWKFFLAKEGDPEKTFVVKDGEIQITGFPNGYLYTDKPYKNYVLRYSWTYPKNQPEKTTMNSGCLVHIQEPHKIWPHSVEPQCRYMDHGKLFYIGFKEKLPQKFDEKAQKQALKESHEWNTTEVTSKDGALEVRINGTLVTTGKSNLTSGPIGFQSEGARIHFKDITIKTLD
jgi:3-keto-disaccharide hydrolase